MPDTRVFDRPPVDYAPIDVPTDMPSDAPTFPYRASPVEAQSFADVSIERRKWAFTQALRQVSDLEAALSTSTKDRLSGVISNAEQHRAWGDAIAAFSSAMSNRDILAAHHELWSELPPEPTEPVSDEPEVGDEDEREFQPEGEIDELDDTAERVLSDDGSGSE